MNKILFIRCTCCALILFVFIPLFSFAQSGKELSPQLKDSISAVLSEYEGKAKLEKQREIYDQYIYPSGDVEFEKSYLSAFLKDAEKAENFEMQLKIREMIVKSLRNNGQTEELDRILPDYFLFAEKHQAWDHYAALSNVELTHLVFRKEQLLQEALDKSLALNNKGKEKKNIKMQLTALKYMGLISDLNDQPEDAEIYFREALALAKKDSDKNELHELYDRLSRFLVGVERDEEALNVAREQEKLLESTPEDHFNRYYCFLRHISALTYLDRLDEAGEYLNKAEYELQFCSPAARHEFQFYKLRHLRTKGQYDEALTMIHDERELMEEKGNLDIASIIYLLENEIQILHEKGEYREAFDKMTRYTHINDSVRSVELAEQVNELRVQFEVEKHIAEKERNRNYLFFALGICALLIVALAIWIAYSRKVNLKNRGLVRQIQEQDRLAEELDNERAEKLKLRKLLQENNEPEEEKEDELFTALQKLMRSNKIYTENGLTRKEVADKLGTNEKYLQESVKKNVGITYQEYLTSLRLNHARELLTTQGDTLTNEAIAIDSGFGSRITLYRLFREHYGLTPEEFKKLVKEKK